MFLRQSLWKDKHCIMIPKTHNLCIVGMRCFCNKHIKPTREKDLILMNSPFWNVLVMGIAQIALDPLPLCQTWKKSACSKLSWQAFTHPGKRGKKVLRAILASLYTHTPFRAMPSVKRANMEKMLQTILVSFYTLGQIWEKSAPSHPDKPLHTHPLSGNALCQTGKHGKKCSEPSC